MDDKKVVQIQKKIEMKKIKRKKYNKQAKNRVV